MKVYGDTHSVRGMRMEDRWLTVLVLTFRALLKDQIKGTTEPSPERKLRLALT